MNSERFQKSEGNSKELRYEYFSQRLLKRSRKTLKIARRLSSRLELSIVLTFNFSKTFSLQCKDQAASESLFTTLLLHLLNQNQIPNFPNDQRNETHPEQIRNEFTIVFNQTQFNTKSNFVSSPAFDSSSPYGYLSALKTSRIILQIFLRIMLHSKLTMTTKFL